MYRCETTSVAGFVQQLAVQYLPHGYWFYVAGNVPEGKDPRAVDRKLVERYDVGISKWTRSRRRGAGEAGVQYLRHGRFFLLLATHGHHRFFEEERAVIRDARRRPVLFGGYSISFRNGRSFVRIAPRELAMLRVRMLSIAATARTEDLAGEFTALRFEPYAPVRSQLVGLLRRVNDVRGFAGLERVPLRSLRLRRRIYRPFGELSGVVVSRKATLESLELCSPFG